VDPAPDPLLPRKFGSPGIEPGTSGLSELVLEDFIEMYKTNE
jgi:hypothetical protein